MHLERFINDDRQLELILMCEEGSPVTAIRNTIIETLMAIPGLDPDFRRRAIYDHDLVITSERRRQLFELGIHGAPANAIRNCMRDVIDGAERGIPTPATLFGLPETDSSQRELSLCA